MASSALNGISHVDNRIGPFGLVGSLVTEFSTKIQKYIGSKVMIVVFYNFLYCILRYMNHEIGHHIGHG